MRVAAIGRTIMLHRTIRALADRGHEVVLIVTAREAPEYGTSAQDFERLARDLGAEFIRSPSVNHREIAGCIRGLAPLDIGISVNYVSVIGQEVIDCFRLGILNAHAGDLPRYRGNAPIAWALLNGEDRIGLCIHRMEGGLLDTGDIIARAYYKTTLNTRIGEVTAWVERMEPVLFLESVAKLQADPSFVLERPSRRPEDGLRCYPRRPEDGRVQWAESHVRILRLIHASSEPYAGAFCMFKGRKLIVWDAELVEDPEPCCALPGQVSAIHPETGSVTVITGEGKIRLLDIGFEGYRGSPAKVLSSIRNRLD